MLVPTATLFKGKDRVATVHTHSMGSGLGITEFSDFYENGIRKGDKASAIMRGVCSYVHGPNGELRRYDPTNGSDILIYNDLPISPKTPWIP